MTFTRTAPVISAMILLAACGGTGTQEIALADIDAAFDELFEVLGDEEAFTPQTEDQLVSLGSASFNGYALAGVEDTDDVFVGRAQIDATFTGGGSLDGEVSDIVHFVGPSDLGVDTFDGFPADTELTSLEGTLTLSGGTLSSTAGTDPYGEIAMTVNGNVVMPEDLSITGNEEDYTVVGEGSGYVDDTDRFLGFSSFNAESSDAGFDGFLYVIAD